MKIGFIGFGEAAYELSLGLKSEGFGDILAYDPMWNHPNFRQLISQKAKQGNVELFHSPAEVLEKVNIIVVAVPANKALEVSEDLEQYLKKGDIYIDVSASTPTIKQQINDHLQDKGVLFVDVAMMGPLPVYKHKVPILASGNGTDEFIKRWNRME